jgi:hypothetical protein
LSAELLEGAHALIVSARLSRGVGDGFGMEAALLTEDEQTTEKSSCIGRERRGVAHNVRALRGRERPKRLLWN